MFISRETAAPPPPPTSSLFLPHSEQNVLQQTSFFTPERTGRLIFALAIKIEEEAPAVSSGELSGRVLQAVPPSCRLTWLRPSAPPGYATRLPLPCTGLPTRGIQAWSCRASWGEFLTTPSRTPWTHAADISIPHPQPPPQCRISQCSVHGLTIQYN